MVGNVGAVEPIGEGLGDIIRLPFIVVKVWVKVSRDGAIGSGIMLGLEYGLGEACEYAGSRGLFRLTTSRAILNT